MWWSECSEHRRRRSLASFSSPPPLPVSASSLLLLFLFNFQSHPRLSYPPLPSSCQLLSFSSHLFCCFAIQLQRGRQQKEELAWRRRLLQDFCLAFCPFCCFFSHLVLFFHTACFDLRVKEILIRCQARDSRGCRRLKRNCIFNRVCVCARTHACASPLRVPVRLSAGSGCWDFCLLMGNNMRAATQGGRCAAVWHFLSAIWHLTGFIFVDLLI